MQKVCLILSEMGCLGTWRQPWLHLEASKQMHIKKGSEAPPFHTQGVAKQTFSLLLHLLLVEGGRHFWPREAPGVQNMCMLSLGVKGQGEKSPASGSAQGCQELYPCPHWLDYTNLTLSPARDVTGWHL